ncbi:hypothetical protein P7D22_10125 [Lichenihabitans sp. Uapishka_5]|uniref:hypothetical protein n=1 Tax=Lichenihabitans sp. Uapishka_5 TaxID=3037302 RepID=UPI0029E7F2E3|nr:hypothetical protein [Lichenihabitans sp. Uapishka_5]MDX7951523.1 hypothetical protein [Lichenihabitans sp. Uapishka_5]
MTRICPLAASLLLGFLSGPALAQSPPASPAGKPQSDCANAAATLTPATQTAPAAADGTAPGNAGSTGWSGGTGGSYLGTTPAGASKDSKTWQPATARGLDPLAPQAPVPKAC